MTEENRRLNIADEWHLSEESWKSAELLREAGQWRDSVGRYYYAAFHAARAALLARGQEPRTHAGVSSQFSRLFVRSGLLEPRHSRLLGRLQRDREQADYSREVIFTEEDANETRAEVSNFRAAVCDMLTAEGWLHQEP